MSGSVKPSKHEVRPPRPPLQRDDWPDNNLEIVMNSVHFESYFLDDDHNPSMLRRALDFARSLEPPLHRRLKTSAIEGNRVHDHPMYFWASSGVSAEEWSQTEEKEVITGVFQI